eukprot:s4159_g2.t1
MEVPSTAMTGSLSTEETLLVLFFLFIYLVWYWRVEGEKCSSSLQLLLRQQFTVPEEEKDSTVQKIETDHLPVARHLMTAMLGTFLVITVAVDSACGIQRCRLLRASNSNSNSTTGISGFDTWCLAHSDLVLGVLTFLATSVLIALCIPCGLAPVQIVAWFLSEDKPQVPTVIKAPAVSRGDFLGDVSYNNV